MSRAYRARMEREAPTASAARRIGLRVALIAGGALVVALVVAVVLLGMRVGALGTAVAAARSPSPKPTASAAPTVAQLFRRAAPSVVLIRTQKDLGTGFVVTAAGSVLTANHVVAGATRITLTFADGGTTTATVASSDAELDIATLTPTSFPSTIVPATIGGGASAGAPVVAIGNPLGLTDSVSSGIVSGTDRRNGSGAGAMTGLIQFDAAVDPGSSGGPLLDAQGSVIGVVDSIADPGHDDAWAGIGFAVPIGAALGAGGGPGDGPGGPQT